MKGPLKDGETWPFFEKRRSRGFENAVEETVNSKISRRKAESALMLMFKEKSSGKGSGH